MSRQPWPWYSVRMGDGVTKASGAARGAGHGGIGFGGMFGGFATVMEVCVLILGLSFVCEMLRYS